MSATEIIQLITTHTRVILTNILIRTNKINSNLTYQYAHIISITTWAFFVESHLYAHMDDKIHVLIMTLIILLLRKSVCEYVCICMLIRTCVKCVILNCFMLITNCLLITLNVGNLSATILILIYY